MKWNTLDVIFGILLLFFSLRGMLRGFVGEVFSVGAVALGLGAGYFFGPHFAQVVAQTFHLPGWGHVVSFLGVFLLVYVLLKILERLFRGFIETLHLQNLDKALGLFLGIGEGLILILLALWGLRVQPVFDAKSLLEGSWVARVLLPLSYSLLHKFPVPKA
ncbi:MAG: CvpA family protein [Spirochaetes bacterium]|nr:CvpA family protein [Spirochaetota bacterium]